MKYIFALIALAVFVGCAGPQTVLVKKCKPQGGDYYKCEVIPEKEIAPHKS